jgi:hypothetical protein
MEPPQPPREALTSDPKNSMFDFNEQREEERTHASTGPSRTLGLSAFQATHTLQVRKCVRQGVVAFLVE